MFKPLTVAQTIAELAKFPAGDHVAVAYVGEAEPPFRQYAGVIGRDPDVPGVVLVHGVRVTEVDRG